MISEEIDQFNPEHDLLPPSSELMSASWQLARSICCLKSPTYLLSIVIDCYSECVRCTLAFVLSASFVSKKVLFRPSQKSSCAAWLWLCVSETAIDLKPTRFEAARLIAEFLLAKLIYSNAHSLH